jgi:Ca2+-binding EF-hand superfamily protein
MTSSKVIFFVAGLAVSSALPHDALAQSKAEIRNMDRNNDGVVTRDEWRGERSGFWQFDVNRDGVLSGTEVWDTATGRRNNSRDIDWTAREFTNLDRNGDNRITADEWIYDRDSFIRADHNRNNVVTRGEFLNEDTTAQNRGNRVDRFRDFDVNNDGVIALDEWRESPIAFRALDRNRDDRITRGEFREVAGTPGRDVAGTSGTVERTPAYRAGFERGLTEGRAAGREDLERNQGFDLEGQRELETADSGYDARFGSRAEYQAGYRDAFRRAYREVWKR